jgi:hypothetical protein
VEPKLFEFRLYYLCFYFLLIELVVGCSIYWVQILYCWLHTLLKERMHRKMQDSIWPHIYEECSRVVIYCEHIIWETWWNSVLCFVPHFWGMFVFGELDGTIFDPTFWGIFIFLWWGGVGTMETFLVLTLSLVVWTSAGPVVTFQHNRLVLVLGTLRLIFG